LSVVLEAAKLLQTLAPSVVINLAGSGTEERNLKTKAEAENIQNVKFLGRLPPGAMPDLYAKSNILLVHLKHNVPSEVSIPSKTFSYMAAGKPILMAVDGEAGEFIELNCCGKKARAGDAS